MSPPLNREGAPRVAIPRRSGSHKVVSGRAMRHRTGQAHKPTSSSGTRAISYDSSPGGRDTSPRGTSGVVVDSMAGTVGTLMAAPLKAGFGGAHVGLIGPCSSQAPSWRRLRSKRREAMRRPPQRAPIPSNKTRDSSIVCAPPNVRISAAATQRGAARTLARNPPVASAQSHDPLIRQRPSTVNGCCQRAPSFRWTGRFGL